MTVQSEELIGEIMGVWARAAVLAAMTGVVAGCSGAGTFGETTCSSEEALALVVDLADESVEEIIDRNFNGSGERNFSVAKVRSTIAQLDGKVDQVRTTKEDPDSTKRFCVARLTYNFPTDVVEDADTANRVIEYPAVAQLARNHGLDRRANAFSTEISYNVQPTDDGDEIYVEIEDADLGIFDFASDVISSHLMLPRVEAQNAQQQLAAQQQEAAEEAAREEIAQASIASAQAELTLSEQRINAVWRAMPQAGRDELLEVQRAWIRKKTADCALEAASSSIVEHEKQVAKMECETRYNQQRTNWLQQTGYMGSDY